MCAVKALTPKIAAEHLMVNALQRFKLWRRPEKLHHSRQTVNSMLKSCEAECLFDICQSDISNVETRWFVIYMLSTHL